MLGVPHDANPRDIRNAFHKLCLVHHPDKSQADEACTDIFHRIVHAKNNLLDQIKRKVIDQAILRNNALQRVGSRQTGRPTMSGESALQSALLAASASRLRGSGAALRSDGIAAHAKDATALSVTQETIERYKKEVFELSSIRRWLWSPPPTVWWQPVVPRGGGSILGRC